jgi:hypothetical protein
MEVGVRILKLLHKTKVDDGDLIRLHPSAQKEVIGLEVTVDDVVRVDTLYP